MQICSCLCLIFHTDANAMQAQKHVPTFFLVTLVVERDDVLMKFTLAITRPTLDGRVAFDFAGSSLHFLTLGLLVERGHYRSMFIQVANRLGLVDLLDFHTLWQRCTSKASMVALSPLDPSS